MGNILILDDEKLVCLQLADLVKANGHTCDFITHPEHFFPILEQDQFDLILMDLYMPGIDGMTLLQQLQKHSVFQHIPVLILTAEVSDLTTAQCFDYGATDYIYKPILPETLKARIQNALDAKRSKEQLEKLVQERTEELTKANQNKDKFFSIIAHDLRSPLLSLQRLTDFLTNEVHDMEPDEIMDFSKRVNNSAMQLHNLLENLLQWSRIQIGELKPELQVIDVSQSIDRVFPLFDELLKKKFIRCTHTFDHDVKVYADSEMLQSILQNLIANAIKYTNKEGNIHVEVKADGKQVTISVSDNGIGISPKHLKKLFRVETKFSKSGTDGERGTGLGLILCKEFIEKQGGQLTVKSQLGEGSVFTIRLPQALESPKVVETNPSAPNFHILIVDDDPDQRLLSQLFLKKLGYQTDTVMDGFEALEKLENETYHLILMDIYMPGMSGIEATKVIFEKLPAKEHPKIVAFTGDVTPDCQKQCQSVGMHGFIKKNATKKEFQQVIENLLFNRF